MAGLACPRAPACIGHRTGRLALVLQRRHRQRQAFAHRQPPLRRARPGAGGASWRHIRKSPTARWYWSSWRMPPPPGAADGDAHQGLPRRAAASASHRLRHRRQTRHAIGPSTAAAGAWRVPQPRVHLRRPEDVRAGRRPGAGHAAGVSRGHGGAQRHALGDWDHSHPSRWALPRHQQADRGGRRCVALSSVHAVVHVSVQGRPSKRLGRPGQRCAEWLRAEVSRDWSSGCPTRPRPPTGPDAAAAFAFWRSGRCNAWRPR